VQTQHEQAARADRSQYAAVNHGRPNIAATPKPELSMTAEWCMPMPQERRMYAPTRLATIVRTTRATRLLKRLMFPFHHAKRFVRPAQQYSYEYSGSRDRATFQQYPGCANFAKVCASAAQQCAQRGKQASSKRKGTTREAITFCLTELAGPFDFRVAHFLVGLCASASRNGLRIPCGPRC